jgi:hypothetical protein
MDAQLQPASRDWIRAVVVSTFVILFITSGIMMPIEKLIDPRRLDRLPPWSRWVLVLPTAFASGLIAEMIPRMLFAVMEMSVNHELLFRPGFDFVIWQLWAPLIFVVGGVQMAPRFKFSTFLVIGGSKIAVSTINLVRGWWFIHRDGSWAAVDPTTNSPIWWNEIIYSTCITCLFALGFLLARQAMEQPRQQSIVAIRRA